jgi:thiol-disulfide isomerase/thioredoxin
MIKKLILVFLILVSSFYYLRAQPDPTSTKIQLEQLLSKYHGKVVYLDFWASWCVPCRKSFPWLNSVQNKYADQGFVVISVNLDANKELALRFLEQSPADFEVIYDPKGDTAKHFAIKGMPSSLLIGREGTIQSGHTGFDIKYITVYEKNITDLLVHKTS